MRSQPLPSHTGDLWIILPEEVNAEQACVSERTVKHRLKKPEPEPPLRQMDLFSRLILGEARVELNDLWAQSPSGFVFRMFSILAGFELNVFLMQGRTCLMLLPS